MTRSAKSRKISKKLRSNTSAPSRAEHAEVADDLKQSLAAAASAVGRAAELLAADAKVGARKGTETVREKALDMQRKSSGKSSRGFRKGKKKSGGGIPQPVINAAVSLAITGVTMLIKRVRRRRAEARANEE